MGRPIHANPLMSDLKLVFQQQTPSGSTCDRQSVVSADAMMDGEVDIPLQSR